MTHKVLITDDLSPRAVEILSAHKEISVEVKTGLKAPDLKKILPGVHALAIRSATKVNADLLEGAPDLKIVGRAGIGVDNVDVKAASKRGVIVMNTPSGNAITTAEHALFLLCSLARHIPQASASMKQGKWDKKKYQGTELFGKNLGVVGLGNIGRIVADRARGLKMKVIAYDPFLAPDAAERMGVELVSLEDLWKRADAISIHTPLTDDTRGLVGAATIAKMKPGVLIVNAARGGIVDEAALLEALNKGHVGGAALDVFVEEPPPAGNPLVAHEKVICTPHLGASTEEAQEKVAVEVAEQLVAFLLHGQIKNAVNLPAVPVEHQERLLPYVDLATRLGLFMGQVASGVRSVQIETVGDIAEIGGKSIAGAALAGLLRPHLDVPVNEVNARLWAQERGVQVSETVRSLAGNYTSSISLRVQSAEGERYIKGTIFSLGARQEARIVQIDAFLCEVVPDGKVLLVRNEDRPGVIGSIGMALGSRGINVSRMQVGLEPGAKEALQLWNIDATLDSAGLDHVRTIAGVRSAQLLSL